MPWPGDFCTWWMGRDIGWPVRQHLIIGGWVITDPSSRPWIYPQVAFNIFKNLQAFISFLSVALVPFFNIVDSTYRWIFSLTGSMSMCKDPTDGDYPRVACNISPNYPRRRCVNHLPKTALYLSTNPKKVNYLATTIPQNCRLSPDCASCGSSRAVVGR